MRALLTGLALLALLPACGARTGSLPPWLTDGGAPPVDAPATDGLRLDGAPPPDRPVHDACLPIPASQVQGSYKGLWKGSWKCPGSGTQSISGTLSFTLTPSGGPESFKVVGSMSGMVAGSFLPFATSISGSMGCTALSAKLPQILVGSGALMIQLTGSISGALTTSSTGKPGFVNGGWSAKETGPTPCTASGSWSAYQ